jgi:hypothetical protein
MQLAIPHHIFDVRHLHLAPFQLDRHGKQLARLAYTDSAADLTDVPLLTPPLRVVDYHADRLRLDLTDQPAFLQKMSAFHEYLVSTFYVHQQGFLGTMGQPYDTVRHLFYFLLDGTYLSVFLHPSSEIRQETAPSLHVGDLRYGDTVRLLIRLHGVSQVYLYGSLRLRIHHSVPCAWLVKDPAVPLLSNRYEMLIRFDVPREPLAQPTAPAELTAPIEQSPPDGSVPITAPTEHTESRYRPSEVITRILRRPRLRVDAQPFVSMVRLPPPAVELFIPKPEAQLESQLESRVETQLEPRVEPAEPTAFRQFVPPEEGQRMCRFSEARRPPYFYTTRH